MASFLEFLKSGKCAEDFINTAVLPQHVVAVSRVSTSPAPYRQDEKDKSGDTSDIPAVASEDLTGLAEDDKEFDVEEQSVLTEAADETPDDDFIRQLEALEQNI